LTSKRNENHYPSSAKDCYQTVHLPIILYHWRQQKTPAVPHEITEHHIKKSQLDWIIVRPAALTDGEHTGSYQHGSIADNKTVTFTISRADTEDFMVKRLTDNTSVHSTPEISY
jgi:putative NADH-flavin reductase